MAVRNFDGTDDVITCSIGTMSAQDSGPITMVVLVRRKATTEMVPMALHTSSGPAADRGRSALDLDSGDSYMLNDVGFAAAGFAMDNDTWLIAAVSKAAGTVAPRFHKYIYSTTTWTHANSGGTMADGGTPGASGTLRFGQWGTSLFFNGRIAVGAIYNQVLSDATLEGFTADAQSWLDAGPVGMWLLNQAAVTTAVEDVTGNGADQTAITGTNVVTGDDPPGFDFTLGGADATVTPGVIACTVALPAAGVNVAAGPSPVAATAALPQPGVNVGSGPSAAALTVAVPQVTAGQSGSNATVTPDTITATAALPQPGVNVAASPAAAAATVALPTAGVGVGAAPGVIAALVAVPQATPDTAGNVTVAPAAVAATAALPAVAVNVAAGPAAIPVVAALPAPTVVAGTDATATPGVIAAVVAVPLVTVDAGTGVTPATIALAAALPQPGILVAAGPGTIVLVVTFPLVARVGPPFPANLFGQGHRDVIGSIDQPVTAGAIGLIVR